LSSIDYSKRLNDIKGLARSLESRKADFLEAAALDAGFPVKITSVEVELAVQHLNTMEPLLLFFLTMPRLLCWRALVVRRSSQETN
jgi:hypothetical protein